MGESTTGWIVLGEHPGEHLHAYHRKHVEEKGYQGHDTRRDGPDAHHSSQYHGESMQNTKQSQETEQPEHYRTYTHMKERKRREVNRDERREDEMRKRRRRYEKE